jgi:hypothetical protein
MIPGSAVLERVRPCLQLLFSGAEIAIDEDLRVAGVVREADYQEAFHHLSMGTREQIAVRVRLAFAEMLVEQGHPETAIFDDALVFSDYWRISRMFDILNMAARNVRVKFSPAASSCSKRSAVGNCLWSLAAVKS